MGIISDCMIYASLIGFVGIGTPSLSNARSSRALKVLSKSFLWTIDGHCYPAIFDAYGERCQRFPFRHGRFIPARSGFICLPVTPCKGMVQIRIYSGIITSDSDGIMWYKGYTIFLIITTKKTCLCGLVNIKRRAKTSDSE